MVEHGALVKLLVDKGIITIEEYRTALVEGAEAEAKRYEVWLTSRYGGKPVTLY
jgi:hypothetical protein